MFFYIYSVFILTKELRLPEDTALHGLMIAAGIELVTIPAFGALSDRLGRRPVYLLGAVFSGLFAFPFFWLVASRSSGAIWVAVIVGLAVGHAAMYGPQAAFFSELFGTRVRYSGASLGYQLSSVVAGGLAPLVAGGLFKLAGDKPWPVAAYMAGAALVTVVSVYLTAETARTDLG